MRKQKVLILGGTQFIGRNLVERLVRLDSYEITLFNRQQTHSDLFPEIQKIKGDRETDAILQIGNINWDYVIDCSCFYPDALRMVLSQISSLKNYIFISTCSVYDNENNHSQLRDEESEILDCNESQSVERTSETYGHRKAECERLLIDSRLPYTILRPALVFGKYDYTDRFYYWLYQVKHNSTLLLPDNGERVFSTTYVFDLVESIVQALKPNKDSVIYNVTTQPKTSIKQIVDNVSALLAKNCETVNATPDFLGENNVAQWMDMPLWIDGDHFTYSNEKLKQELETDLVGFEEAVKSTLEYYSSLNWPKPKYGISEERREELLTNLEKRG